MVRMTVSREDQLEIAKIFTENIYLETGRDLRELPEEFFDLMDFVDGFLVHIGFGGLQVPVLSPRLFEGMDVSHVKTLYLLTTDTRILEEETFEDFKQLELVKLFQTKLVEEFNIPEKDNKRIRFEGLDLKSDNDITFRIHQQFLNILILYREIWLLPLLQKEYFVVNFLLYMMNGVIMNR